LALPVGRSAAGEAPKRPLFVYLFSSSTCEGCREIKAGLFGRLQAQHGDAVRLVHVPVDDVRAFKLQLLYEDRYGVKDGEALKVFVGTQCLSGKRAILERLEAVIAEELAKGSRTPTPDEVRASAAAKAGAGQDACGEARQRFGEFKPAAIALAGLVDGINPCAFTTLVFFISLLASLGKGRREMLAVGLCFALAVFVAYFALGLGALKAVKVFSVNSGVAKGLTWAVAALTLVFAGLSFADFFRYRQSGDGEDMALKLPGRIRRRIRSFMSRQMHTRNLVVGALIAGVVVSLLEAVCTGQVYVPTIMCVARDPDLAARAVGYLALYNGMFIAPLLVVFAVAYFGVGSERLAAFSRRNVGVAKLLLGFVFLGLAGILIATTV